MVAHGEVVFVVGYNKNWSFRLTRLLPGSPAVVRVLRLAQGVASVVLVNYFFLDTVG